MNPTPSDLHVSQLLTDVAIKYVQNANAFVASRVFPVVPVDKQADRYTVFNRGDFFREQMTVRGPGAPVPLVGYKVDTTPTYYCPVKAEGKAIQDQERANADAVFNQDSDAVTLVTQHALIHREGLFAANYMATSKWTSEWAGVASGASTNQFVQWNSSSSDPIVDLTKGIETVQGLTGFKPNKLVLGVQVWNVLKNNADIQDRIKYGATPGSPSIVTRQAMAALLELDEILVMEAVKTSSVEGATDAFAFIGGKHALLAYAAPNPSKETPSAGYTFAWRGYMGATSDGFRVKKYRREEIAADVIEIEMAVDVKQTAADLGFFFKDAVA